MPETKKARRRAESLAGMLRVARKKIAELNTWPLLEGYRAGREGKPDDPRQSADWREGWARAKAQHSAARKDDKPRSAPAVRSGHGTGGVRQSGYRGDHGPVGGGVKGAGRSLRSTP